MGTWSGASPALRLRCIVLTGSVAVNRPPETAIDLFTTPALVEAATQSAQNPALKTWAAETLPIIQHHLEMAEEVQAQLQ